jgi:hypothetical protein
LVTAREHISHGWQRNRDQIRILETRTRMKMTADDGGFPRGNNVLGQRHDPFCLAR